MVGWQRQEPIALAPKIVGGSTSRGGKGCGGVLRSLRGAGAARSGDYERDGVVDLGADGKRVVQVLCFARVLRDRSEGCGPVEDGAQFIESVENRWAGR